MASKNKSDTNSCPFWPSIGLVRKDLYLASRTKCVLATLGYKQKTHFCKCAPRIPNNCTRSDLCTIIAQLQLHNCTIIAQGLTFAQ